ncbi:hypothetical protein AGLY_000636 [Aphis glycines]|uniref:Uncharacterized protein n=1 Tax=Aphis glycines TaxID=307491 RepID=A0A6G0U815_APHGL|nr:hypothetical protein AGLY_000636 [Aphis glycines]
MHVGKRRVLVNAPGVAKQSIPFNNTTGMEKNGGRFLTPVPVPPPSPSSGVCVPSPKPLRAPTIAVFRRPSDSGTPFCNRIDDKPTTTDEPPSSSQRTSDSTPQPPSRTPRKYRTLIRISLVDVTGSENLDRDPVPWRTTPHHRRRSLLVRKLISATNNNDNINTNNSNKPVYCNIVINEYRLVLRRRAYITHSITSPYEYGNVCSFVRSRIRVVSVCRRSSSRHCPLSLSLLSPSNNCARRAVVVHEQRGGGQRRVVK